MTEEFARHLDDEFLAHTREIYSIKEGKTYCNIFSFETDFEIETENETYYKNIVISKETSIFMRNEYIRLINEKIFSCNYFLENDAEVMFSINKCFNFLRNYRYAYYLIKSCSNSNQKAKKLIKKAIIYKSMDIKSRELLEACN